MFLLLLKDLSLTFGSIFLLNVLLSLVLWVFPSSPAASARRTSKQNKALFIWFIGITLFLQFLNLLVWPIYRLTRASRPEGRWVIDGWSQVFWYTALGVCLFLVGWAL